MRVFAGAAALAAVANAKIIGLDDVINKDEAENRLLGALGSKRTTHAGDYVNQWREYVEREALEFRDFDHEAERFEIFKDNVDVINRHNAQKLSWTMGLTPFAHLTAEEFAEQMGFEHCALRERRNTDREVWLNTTGVADQVDWTAKGMVTEVKNQGRCGSCWAFSTTGAVESRSAIKTGKLIELSEQELVDCGAPEGSHGCKGGLMDFGFEYVEKEHGLCTEESYAYTAKEHDDDCKRNRRACGAHQDPIKGHKDVPKNNSKQLQAAVAEGPVSVAIQANQAAFQLYKGGVMSGRCGRRLDHGVLVVGYGTEKGQDFWKVKNSWGPTWGEEGYIRLCRNCHKDWGKGQCGILGQPSYPVV